MKISPKKQEATWLAMAPWVDAFLFEPAVRLRAVLRAFQHDDWLGAWMQAREARTALWIIRCLRR
jgi:hypothetical protein